MTSTTQQRLCSVLRSRLVLTSRNESHQPALTTKRHFSDSLNESAQPTQLKRVAVLGGGSWGTTISKVIGANVLKHPHLFEPNVFLYLRDQNLRLIIEKTRENIRYLTGIKIPSNVEAISDLNYAVSQSDILIFVIPHEYIHEMCYAISGPCIAKKKPIGVSLIKGLHIDGDGNLERTTEIIERMLSIKCGVLSGANVALDVARGEFCEATLSTPEAESADTLKTLFQADYFRINVNDDLITVEMCGALKNVVACGAGFVDGLDLGPNTKAAAIRCGLSETIKFVSLFHPNYKLSTFFENCGIADMISSSFAGRNRKVMKALIKSNKPLSVLEREILGGQKLQGPHTAEVVYNVLEKRNLINEFPFFSTVHKICLREEKPIKLIDALRVSC
ncbi:Glycerol-3-phosphate dehydrogenase [NAD(+)], cytoplasmic [Halotydeus destructor]|nr:Glycerol-3-phosphate dehydrogenase [NAD(+)], cytoplasmic [Halotydeus destructor]